MMTNLRNNSHGGNIWTYVKQSKNRPVDFSVNTGPLGPSLKVKAAVIKNIDTINYYPEPESQNLKNAIASFHRVNTNNILIGNGSIEFIYLVPRIIESRDVLINAPAFSEYEFAVKAARKNPIFTFCHQEDGFKINLKKIENSVPMASLVFLCNPNNPTGSLLTAKDALFLLRLCEKNKTILVIDEAFIDFTRFSCEMELISKAVKSSYLLILRSLTKFFSIAGLRLGYLIGQAGTINKIRQLQYPWNVNSFAQIAGIEALKDKKYIKQNRDCVSREKEYLFDRLKDICGIKIYPSEANFFLCRLSGSKLKKASFLSSRLLKKGILIRDCANFRGLDNSFFRIAVKQRKDNAKLILALRNALNET